VVYALLPLSNLLALLLRYVGGGCAIACGVRAADVRLPRLDWLTRVAAQLERRLVHRADVVIVNSQNGARFLYGDHRPGNVLVIDNGIETQDYSYDPSGRARLRDAWGLGADTPLVGCVARLDPIKDHATLLRAFAQLRQMRADAQLVCVGTPAEPLQAQLRDLARRLGIDAAVRWIERVPQVRELYSALDAVCLSSTSEGFPNVLAEAMACGVPCVATDVGDTRRILSTADFVVPPRNPEALAGALAAALAQARQFSDLRADKIRREFSAQALVERTEVALSSALQRRDARVLKGAA
jgi:glycosyltransferase involved in cell wall biosynthesis